MATGKYFFAKAPPNRPPWQAFACSPLSRSDRPPLQACDLRSNAPPDRLCRRSFSAFPPPPDRLCRRSTCGGVGCGAINRPSASAFGWVALLRFAPLRSLDGILSPLRSDHVRKENCKKLCFSQFFFRQIAYTPTNYTTFALQIERRVKNEYKQTKLEKNP